MGPHFRKKIFPALAEGLWLLFLFLDLTQMASSTWVKFAAICLCCATALLGAKTPDGKLVAAALCLTLAADWLLLVRNAHYTLGVCLFILVQFLYAYRLYRLRGKRLCGWGLAVRLAALLPVLFLLLGVLLLLLRAPWPVLEPFLYVLLVAPGSLTAFPALFYFANLCVNAAEAFALGKSRRTFAWGLLLFILCDICVGAYNLGLAVSVTWWASWLFYLPSQVLIVLSQEQKTGDTYEKTI